MIIEQFAEEVRGQIIDYVSPAQVAFRGSFATRTFDQFSDVDVQAHVEAPLNADFFGGLEDCLQRRFGAALVRYDPDYKETTTAQDVRFSFYNLPVFWRVDFLVQASQPTNRKYPSPFPEWSVGVSALMNAIWALKYLRRGREDDAQRYLTAACHKIGSQDSRYSMLELLDRLAERTDVDSILLMNTREAVNRAT
jgi:hypothetical protein